MNNFNNITEFLDNIDNALNLDTMGDSRKTFIDSKAELKVYVTIEESARCIFPLRYVVHVRSTKLSVGRHFWGCENNAENKIVAEWMAKNETRILDARMRAEDIEEARLKAILG